MLELQEYSGQCPYCGETISLLLDHSAGSQTYIEDCSVCCRPIQVSVYEDNEGELHISLQHENETG